MSDPLQGVKINLSKLWTSGTSKLKNWLFYDLVEGAVLGIFDIFTGEDLYRAIIQDVNIWESDWEEGEEFRFQFQMLSRDPRFREHAGLLTPENVLTWLADDKSAPEKAGVIINTPGGPEWLVRQVEGIKRGLEAPLVEEEPVEESQG